MSSTITKQGSITYKENWTPKEYQLRAIRMMMQQAAVGLFLDPGLGKTSICLAAFKILKEKGICKKMLVVAPLRACYSVWPEEIKKWADFSGLTYTIVHGNKEEALRQDVDIYVVNFEGLLWLLDLKRKRPEFDVLCVDESTKFKDSSTRRFKALKPFIPHFARRWILTGTPTPNGLIDLFGQMYILDTGRALERFVTHFKTKYFAQSGFGGYTWTPLPGSFQAIVERIAPLVLQLSAEDYLKMPELVYLNIAIDLPTEARKIYKEVEEEFITKIENHEIVAQTAAVAGGKCRQIANGALYTGTGKAWVPIHGEKLEALKSLLEELSGHPVIILYDFIHDAERILELYPAARNLSGMAGERLADAIRSFNAGDIPIIIGHPASMGHSLNLQSSCHHIIWFGIPWSLELYDQAIARVYRQGQQSERVFVYHLVAKDTLDEKVMRVLTVKDRTQQELLSALV